MLHNLPIEKKKRPNFAVSGCAANSAYRYRLNNNFLADRIC